MVDAIAYADGDDCFLVWTHPRTDGCRGFSLRRSISHPDGSTATEVLENFVGFAADQPTPHEHRPSTEWPLQRYTWTDHRVGEGDLVSYTITPIVRSDGTLVERTTDATTVGPVTITSGTSSKRRAVFNRGIVLSQFVASRLPMPFTDADLRAFKADLEDDDSELRAFLSGQLGTTLTSALAAAEAAGHHLFAALYELDDDHLVEALRQFGQRAHLILANGSQRERGSDGNRAAAEALAGTIDLHRRMLWTHGLGHNKFVVFARTPTDPYAVWTGSTNWATTGLCTQMNNGLHVEDDALAETYLAHWQLLKDDQAEGPDGRFIHFRHDLMASNDVPHEAPGPAPKQWTAWFTRTSDEADLQALAEVVDGARDGILFLMFEPGATGLLQTIQARLSPASPTYDPALYIQGVVNTIRPGGQDVAVVTIGDGNADPFDLRIVQPEGIATNLGNWAAEVTRDDFLMPQGVIGHAIIHSKVVVVDPFTNPVVVTGSHNFSASASHKNDENFLIIRGDRELAERFAVNVMSTYQHYRWRAYLLRSQQAGRSPWSFLVEADGWQQRLETDARALRFWLRH